MRLLSESDVESLLDMHEAVEAAALAYRLHASRAVLAPVRANLYLESPKAGCLVLAGAYEDVLTVKSNVHALGDEPGAVRMWGGLLALWDVAHARPRALLSSRAFNDHRTAAGFAAAARILAPKDARVAAIFGAGKTAPMALRYLRLACPPVEQFLIVGRRQERAEALATLARAWPEMKDRHITATCDARRAVETAQVIVTVTTSDTPVLAGAAVRDGAFIILGGANRPQAREADDDLMRRARIFVDASAGAMEKAGDLALARASGALREDQIAGEIGSIDESAPPVLQPGEVVVFKSMGLAIQDAVLAKIIVEKAEARGVGRLFDLEGATP